MRASSLPDLVILRIPLSIDSKTASQTRRHVITRHYYISFLARLRSARWTIWRRCTPVIAQLNSHQIVHSCYNRPLKRLSLPFLYRTLVSTSRSMHAVRTARGKVLQFKERINSEAILFTWRGYCGQPGQCKVYLTDTVATLQTKGAYYKHEWWDWKRMHARVRLGTFFELYKYPLV